MLGSICGDMIGSRFERCNISNEDFGPLFSSRSVYTDDTVLTVATAEVILNGGTYAEEYLKLAEMNPNRGYGGHFEGMVKRGRLEPYNSYGNGSAMRISPVGWMYGGYQEGDYEKTLDEAKRSSECTHSHPEGIKGAQAIASSIYIARLGGSKENIKTSVEKLGYDLSKKTSDFRQGQFDVTCQGTIPRCMAVFLETEDFESAMRKAVSLGGDTDTNCCIVGSICDGMYGLPKQDIVEEVYARLPKYMADVITAFTKKYIDKDFIQPDNVGNKSSTFNDSLSSLFS